MAPPDAQNDSPPIELPEMVLLAIEIVPKLPMAPPQPHSAIPPTELPEIVLSVIEIVPQLPMPPPPPSHAPPTVLPEIVLSVIEIVPQLPMPPPQCQTPGPPNEFSRTTTSLRASVPAFEIPAPSRSRFPTVPSRWPPVIVSPLIAAITPDTTPKTRLWPAASIVNWSAPDRGFRRCCPRSTGQARGQRDRSSGKPGVEFNHVVAGIRRRQLERSRRLKWPGL